MAVPKLYFPPHEGLPDLSNPAGWGLAPTVNGFIEPDVGVSTDRAADETGWKRSSRITYQGAGGVSSVVFQGLKHAGEDAIFLSFLVRFDSYFDQEDAIVIVLRPSYSPPPATAAHTLDTVRIDVYPVTEGVGAGPAGPPLEPTYQTRSNHPPHRLQFRRWDGTGWSAPFPVPNVEVKCRSWDAGIGQHNKCWSVELKLPTKPSGGGTNWIDLTTSPSFGLYCNVVRVCGSDLCQDLPVGFPTDVYAAFQYTWPRKVDLESAGFGNGIIRSTLGETSTYLDAHPLDARWLGEASLEATGARGVSFVAIGTNPAAPGGPLNHTLDGALPTNTLVARIKHDGEVTAGNVTATFRLANWGIGPGSPDKWELVGSLPDPGGSVGPNPPSAGTTLPGVPPMGTPTPVDLTLAWTMGPTAKARYQPPHGHQCVWVVLSSDLDVNFVEGSRHTNLNFVNLSEHESEVEISGVGHPDPDANGEHHILLHSSPRLLLSSTYLGDLDDRWHENEDRKLELLRRLPTEEPTGLQAEVFRRWIESGALGKAPIGTLLWIVNAYRATDGVLGIGQKAFRVYDPISTFTYSAQHIGETMEWRTRLFGDNRLTTVADHTYIVRVPDGGAVRLRANIKAVAPEEYGALDRVLRFIDRVQAVLFRLRACGDRLDAIRALLRQLGRLARASFVPQEITAVLAVIARSCEELYEQTSVLARIGAVVQAIEQYVEDLDGVLDTMRAVDPERRADIVRKLYGADADTILGRMARLEKEVHRIGDVLLSVLLRVLDRLESLLGMCNRIDALFGLLRELERRLGKVRLLGMPGVGLDKFLQGPAGAGWTKVGARPEESLSAYASMLAEAVAIRSGLGDLLDVLQGARRTLEKLDDGELAGIVERVHRAATT